MSDAESDRFYASAAKRHRSGPLAVGWSGIEAQEGRFAMMDAALDFDGARVLDVGCGLGALAGYLRDRGRRIDYVGIDTVPRMIHSARTTYPEDDFHRTDLAGAVADGLFEPMSFDYVVASGTFSRRGACDAGFVVEFAELMFGLCSSAAAFNSLSSRFARNARRGFAVDPAEIAVPLMDIGGALTMRHCADLGDVSCVLRRAAEPDADRQARPI